MSLITGQDLFKVLTVKNLTRRTCLLNAPVQAPGKISSRDNKNAKNGISFAGFFSETLNNFLNLLHIG